MSVLACQSGALNTILTTEKEQANREKERNAMIKFLFLAPTATEGTTKKRDRAAPVEKSSESARRKKRRRAQKAREIDKRTTEEGTNESY